MHEGESKPKDKEAIKRSGGEHDRTVPAGDYILRHRPDGTKDAGKFLVSRRQSVGMKDAV